MKADQLSQTATFVAVKFYGMTQMEQFRSLFDDSVLAFYDRLVQTLPAPIRYYHFWLKFSWIRKLYIWSEELLLPGDLLHIVARKWHIQQFADELVDNGYEQIIILGAGFDHLGFHYANLGLPCFEFDAPYMAKRKRRFLDEWYSGQPHPQIITSHLPDDQLGALFAKHQDIKAGKKTIIIAEGFFDYLDTAIVSSSLRDIRNFFTNAPALISTHFALGELSPFHRWVFTNSVKMVNERLEFHSSMNEFSDLLKKEGFDIQQLLDSQKISANLHSRLHTNLDILKGFYILTAH